MAAGSLFKFHSFIMEAREVSADRQAAARILGVQNGFSDCLKPCFLKILVLVLGEAFISIANIARARVAHVTAPAEMMYVLFPFWPHLWEEGSERERACRNCHLLAARVRPASGFPENTPGLPENNGCGS